MKMKLFIVSLIALVLFNSFLNVKAMGNSEVTFAQNDLAISGNRASVTFAELGYPDTDLVGPFDSSRVQFSLPSNFRLAQGGEFELNYNVFMSGADVANINSGSSLFGGVLLIVFNRQVVGNIRLTEQGNQTIRFQIPPEALLSTRDDGRHDLVITLNAQQFSCKYDIRTVVTVRNVSLFDLPLEVSSPNLNLAKLPAPFYLRDSLLPNETLFVVPDQATAAELKAAMNVIAGFGSVVGSDFLYELVDSKGLTTEKLAASNLVFVGKPDRFNLLTSVAFPIPIETVAENSKEDGSIQLALSPWNANREVLLVSGASDDSVLKAAQAVSSGKIFVYNNPVLAYVSSVQLMVSAFSVVQDFSLANLGYDTQTISGIGVNSSDYVFHLSKEQVASQDGFFDLAYYHSGLMDYGSSSLSVNLNGQVLASAPFSKESEQITTLHIKIPPGILRFGENRISISTKMLPQFACDLSGLSDPWLVVLKQSSFSIPLAPVSTTIIPSLLDLKFYPNLLITQSDLGDIAFVVPQDNVPSWKVAANIAFDLGRTVTPTISNLEVVFGNDSTNALLKDRSIILVGRASTLPILTEMNEKLPAPFDPKTDTASERNLQITYRIPDGVKVGYLQLLVSPFNSGRVAMVVSGNTDEGLTMAMSTILNGTLKGQLAGSYAVTNGTQIALGSNASNFSTINAVAPGAEPVVITTPLPTGSPSIATPKPVWLLPILVLLGLIILVVIAYILLNGFFRQRASQINEPDEKPDD